MTTFFTFLAVLIIIAAVLLIIVVLLQNGKGDGLASNFIAGNQTFGVRQTADLLEKVTWGLVAFILVVSIISTFTLNSKKSDLPDSAAFEQAASSEGNLEFPSTPIEQAAPSTEASETEAE